MTHPLCPSGAFTPEFVEGVRAIFEEKIVFNQVLGLKLISMTPTEVHARLEMKPQLVGHFAYNRLHGGVISAALDALGGTACMAALGARYAHEPVEQQLAHFMSLGTIDLRIDYLRQGIGEFFEMRAEVLRLGSRVGSTRMEFFGPDGKLVATGCGAYIVS
jgi:uncharacterized protein (TIGR00369 family)